MSAATPTYSHGHVHVPATWIVWLIAVLAVILLLSAVVATWDRASAGSAPTPVRIHATPAPAPEPMIVQSTAGRLMIGEPYPGRAGVDGWLS